MKEETQKRASNDQPIAGEKPTPRVGVELKNDSKSPVYQRRCTHTRKA